MTQQADPLSVLGKSGPNLDAYERVTGLAKYTGDLELPGMLVARVLRSPHAHARIVSIDTSRAEALQGVKAVVTHKDAPKVMVWGSRQYLLNDRVRFAGEVDDDEIVRLYAGALGVIFPPYDEDYGYVTLEAFLSGKPVVTTTDAGGPTEFVVDGVNGRVTAPDPEALGEAIQFLAADRRRAASLGDAGYDRARQITWTGVIEALVQIS